VTAPVDGLIVAILTTSPLVGSYVLPSAAVPMPAPVISTDTTRSATSYSVVVARDWMTVALLTRARGGLGDRGDPALASL
jgi:hypothetical protein